MLYFETLQVNVMQDIVECFEQEIFFEVPLVLHQRFIPGQIGLFFHVQLKHAE